MILTTSNLRRRRMTSIQELLYYLINIQDPSHQAVHLLVQAFKPELKRHVNLKKGAFYDSFVS